MSLKWKIISLVMLMIVLITSAFIAVLFQFSNKSIERQVNHYIHDVQSTARTLDERQKNTYTSRIKNFVDYNAMPNKDALINAFARRDRKELLQRSSPFLQILQNENPYFHTLAWVTPDNHSFLRVHSPGYPDGDISTMRPDVVEANRVLKQNEGYIVAGPGIVYAIVQPVSYHGKHLGTVQFGIKGHFLLDAVCKSLKFPVGFLISNEKYRFVVKPPLPALTGASYTLQSRNLSFFEKITDQVDWNLDRQRIQLLDKTYEIVKVLNHLDYKGQLQGNMVVALDISQPLAESNRLLIWLIVLFTLLLVGSFFILYFSFGFLLDKITNLNQSLRQNNTELAKTKDRLEFTVEGARLGIWDWNIQTGKEVFNERCAEMLGYRMDELEQHVSTWENLIHPDDAAKTLLSQQKHLDGQTPVYMTEHRLRHKSGKWVWVIGAGKVIERDSEGAPLRLVGMLLDISSQKEQEELRLQTSRQEEELKRLDSLQRMASSIAHRFNNSMMAVLGNLELMTLTLPEESEGHQMASDAAQAAGEAAKIGSIMLSYTGQQSLRFKEKNLSDLVEESISELDAMLQQPVSLIFTPSAQPLICSADPKQMKEVIESIITNSVESLEEGAGTVEVRLGSEYFSADSFPLSFQSGELKNGVYAWCRIKDNGHGISPENLSRIFDPFYTTRFLGRGLGLALAVGIMRSHHGAIMVQSTPDKETTFTILLPALLSSLQSEPPPAKEKSVIGQLTGDILLADDEQMLLTVGGQLLQLLGFTVHTVTNGQDAVDRVRRGDVDFCAVIMDISMPVMDGITAMEEIKKIDPVMPVILSSGYPEAEFSFQEEGRHDGFLAKPFQLADVRSCIETALKFEV